MSDKTPNKPGKKTASTLKQKRAAKKAKKDAASDQARPDRP
jgi:hypothetical protein